MTTGSEVGSEDKGTIEDILRELGKDGHLLEINGFSGESISQIIVALSSFIVPVITALIAKYAGKVAIKIDGIEIEASNSKEAKELLKLAYSLKESVKMHEEE